MALLVEVEGGEEIEITRRGRTVARQVAMTSAADENLVATGATWELD